jgi:hypothetical protein
MYTKANGKAGFFLKEKKYIVLKFSLGGTKKYETTGSNNEL